jgi:hypothetical protein
MRKMAPRVFTRSLAVTSTAVSLALAGLVIAQAPAAADESLGVGVIGQQESRWASAQLGASAQESIGSAGCAVTSVAMLLAYYGVQTSPRRLNDWLTANGGYAEGDLLIWTRLSDYVPNRFRYTGWHSPEASVINAELDAGRPVVAEVRLGSNQHFIVLAGRSRDDYTINDPWFDDSVTLRARYGDPRSAIVSIRTFAGIPMTAAGTPISTGEDDQHQAQ